MENSNGDKVVLDTASGGTEETAGYFILCVRNIRVPGRERATETGGWVGGGSLASGRGWSNLCCGGSLNNLAWMALAAAAAAGD